MSQLGRFFFLLYSPVSNVKVRMAFATLVKKKSYLISTIHRCAKKQNNNEISTSSR